MYELYQEADHKQMITIKRPEGMGKDSFKEWWFDHAMKLKTLPGLKWYTILFSLETSPFGPPAFDGFEELWFGSMKELEDAYNTDIMQNELENIRKHGVHRIQHSRFNFFMFIFLDLSFNLIVVITGNCHGIFKRSIDWDKNIFCVTF